MKISAVILTKNEEINIEACLESLAWTDEQIVIDDNSTDKTVVLAEKRNAKIYKRSLDNDFASQRNFGLEKAKGEWVFFVDADERISSLLREEILGRINGEKNKFHGYYIKRQDTMWGKLLTHGEQGNTYLLRLAKKDMQSIWIGKVHERWKVREPIGVLKNSLTHFPHPTLKEFLAEINFYSTLRSNELYKEKIDIHWWDIIVYPKAKFFQDYFVKLGLLDGVQGFLAAVLMSFHSFLVRSKLWQLNND